MNEQKQVARTGSPLAIIPFARKFYSRSVLYPGRYVYFHNFSCLAAAPTAARIAKKLTEIAFAVAFATYACRRENCRHCTVLTTSTTPWTGF
jgi:hypothetical protein